MDLYIETLDQLQSIIDNCDPESPIAIVGDMNTTLPQLQELAPNWFRNKPFAARSGILYEYHKYDSNRSSNSNRLCSEKYHNEWSMLQSQ